MIDDPPHPRSACHPSVIHHRSIHAHGPILHGLFLPGDDAVADLVFLHGYGDHAMRYTHAMRPWSRRGINLHALDLRGHGVSTGRRAFVQRWSDYLTDVRALLDTPPLRDSALPRFILGHSHGGLVAVAGILHDAFTADGLILSAPYLHPAHRIGPSKRLLAHLLNPILPALRVPTGLHSDAMTRDPAMQEQARHDTLLLRRATPRWFLQMRKVQTDVLSRAEALAIPLLLAHGDDDQVSDLVTARGLVEAASSADKTQLIYPGGKHELLRDLDRERVIDDIASWILQRASQRPDHHPRG